jgi:hypothetical protein
MFEALEKKKHNSVRVNPAGISKLAAIRGGLQ